MKLKKFLTTPHNNLAAGSTAFFALGCGKLSHLRRFIGEVRDVSGIRQLWQHFPKGPSDSPYCLLHCANLVLVFHEVSLEGNYLKSIADVVIHFRDYFQPGGHHPVLLLMVLANDEHQSGRNQSDQEVRQDKQRPGWHAFVTQKPVQDIASERNKRQGQSTF